MKQTVFYGLFLFLLAQGTANPVLPDSNHQALTFQADLSGRCPTGYSQPDNSNWPYCYQVLSDIKTPKDAATQCKASNGSLASVHSSLANSFIYYLATQVDATSVWLGVECFNGDKTTCMNNDGTKFNYSSFRSGQPDSYDNCVYLSTAGRDSQQWSTFDCQQKFAYACEKTAGTTVQTPSTPPPRTLKCPSGYEEYQTSGMCYKFVDLGSTQVSGNNASAECRKIPRGNLAIITNNGTNTFLTNIERNGGYPYDGPGNGPISAFGLLCPNVVFDGDTRSCVWDDGTPFGFSAFYATRPSTNANGYCSFREGMWLGCNKIDTPVFTAYLCQAPKQ